jgi:hypothetical protein
MKLTKEEKKRLQIGAGILILLFLIWWLCGFGGPSPWAIDLNSQLGANACPASCWLTNGSGNGSNGGGSPTNQCPPLYTKLNSADPAVINAGVSACLIAGGRSVTSDYEVSCRDDLGRIDCEALSGDPNNARFAYLCHLNGGIYKCQDNFVGCYCPGNIPLPKPVNCGRTLFWDEAGSSWTRDCVGYCQSGSCMEIEGTCICSEEETPCEQMDSQSCSLGECPPGSFCAMNIAMTGCDCKQIPL